jgi:hypothetical protein
MLLEQYPRSFYASIEILCTTCARVNSRLHRDLDQTWLHLKKKAASSFEMTVR